MTGRNPFLLIARIGVKENMIEEYLAIAEEVDNAVQESEPGMLFHNFDKDPDDPLGFVWSEVYTDSEALIAHINNPPVQAYVEKHDELADTFEIEVYGNLSEDAISAVKALEVPFKHFKSTHVGYVRDNIK